MFAKVLHARHESKRLPPHSEIPSLPRSHRTHARIKEVARIPELQRRKILNAIQKCCLEFGVLEPDYSDIIVSIQKNKSLQKGDQEKRFTVAEDMDDEDEAMFHQLVDLWETNKGDIEEYVFKLVPADNEIEQKDMMKDKYNELVELLEARLNGRKALELYTELLQGI